MSGLLWTPFLRATGVEVLFVEVGGLRVGLGIYGLPSREEELLPGKDVFPLVSQAGILMALAREFSP